MATQSKGEKKLKVVVSGASGETGRSITNALLAEPNQFHVTVLGRASTVSGPVYQKFAEQNAIIRGVHFQDHEVLVEALGGADVVVSCLSPAQTDIERALIEAAHKANVGRFVPSFFATVGPRGMMPLRDAKEATLDKIQALYLPYTVIDVGWWMQLSIPLVPSGRLDSRISAAARHIVGDGNTMIAVTDQRDIGRFVTRVIADPRTLNKRVFAYGDVVSQNQVFATVERYTGESITRGTNLSEQMGKDIIMKSTDVLAANPGDVTATVTKAVTEYKMSWGIRGDNTPEHAAYLGYLDGRELYPNLETMSMDCFVRELVEGGRDAIVYAPR